MEKERFLVEVTVKGEKEGVVNFMPYSVYLP